MEKDEHFMNCVYYIILAKEDKEFRIYQIKFLYTIIKYIENCPKFDSIIIKNLFEKLLEDRDVYLRYFFQNKFLYNALFEMLTKKLITENVNKTNVISMQRTSSISFCKVHCNSAILDIFIKLSQNVIIDIEKAAETLNKPEEPLKLNLPNLKLKAKKVGDDPSITTSKNWHMTINNLVHFYVNGNVLKKPRETILAPCDYEKEIESDDEEDSDDEEEKKQKKQNLYLKDINEENCKEVINFENQADIDFLVTNLTNATSIIILNFSTSNVHKSKLFGIENIKKLTFINNYLEVLVFLNFMGYVKQKATSMTTNIPNITGNISKNSTGNLVDDTPWDVTISKVNIDSELIIDFLNSLLNCFFKFQENSLMHKEVEFMVTFIVSRFCPFSLTRYFINECKSLEQFITFNKNLKSKESIPHQIINICEVITRIFISESSIVQKALEQSKFLFNFRQGTLHMVRKLLLSYIR